MTLQCSCQFAVLISVFNSLAIIQHLLKWLHMVLLLQWFHASKVLNVLMEMTRREWKLSATGMKNSLNSILSIHKESYGWIVPWMLRATLHGRTESESTVTISLAGIVGFLNVKKMVESTDTCVSARHVANMSADMLVTRPKIVSAEVLTMLSQHVTYGYVGNISAL